MKKNYGHNICTLSSPATTISRCNTMFLVRNTKTLIQQLREDGWNNFFAYVRSFCVRHDIEIPDLDDFPSATRFGRSTFEENHVTIEHYFRVETFFTIANKQLQELNSRLQTVDLLTPNCALTPKDSYKPFDVDIVGYQSNKILSCG